MQSLRSVLLNRQQQRPQEQQKMVRQFLQIDLISKQFLSFYLHTQDKQYFYGPPVIQILTISFFFFSLSLIIFFALRISAKRRSPVRAQAPNPTSLKSNAFYIYYNNWYKWVLFDNTNNINFIILSSQMGTCNSQPSVVADSSSFRDRQTTKRNFNPFYEQHAQNQQQQRIMSKYAFHSNYDDKFLGRCCILQDRQTHDMYLSKQIQISNEEQFQQKLQAFKERKSNLINENIVQIKDIIQKQSEGFLFQNKKLIVIVDYPLTNLQKQMNNRVVNRLEFTKQQILNILISCIKGYSLIERCGYHNDKIRLKNIFFGIKNKETLIKVPDSIILPQPTNLNCIEKNQFEVAQNRDIYLSPEQFNSYIDKDRFKVTSKQGVYSFGMSLLDLCLMQSSREAYHYDDRVMDFNQVRNRILIAGKKYGAIVQRFLDDMLQINERKRPSFQQLQKKIPSLVLTRNNTQGSRMNLSVARSTSHYLNNDRKSLRNSASRDSRNNRSRSNSMNRSLRSQVSGYSMSSQLGRRMRGQLDENEQLQRVHEIYSNGNEYIGQKKGTLKHGKGKYKFKDGSYYDGQWRNNKMDGKGDLFFPDETLEYSGQWKSDQYNGWGVLKTSSKSDSQWIKYQGQFKNGVMEGRGQMTFKDGSIYDGQFRGGKLHGRGKHINQTGAVIKDKFWQIINPDLFLSAR